MSKQFKNSGIIKLSASDYNKADLDVISRFLGDIAVGLLELHSILEQKIDKEKVRDWNEDYLV